MGIMKALFGTGNASTASTASNGDHNIDRDRVLAPTTNDVFTPTNPGTLETMRTAPIVPRPRYFTREEANAIGELATEAKSNATHTKRAYKHLRTLEETDTTVTKEHFRYGRKVAGKEVEKQQARTLYAKKLHRLRPAYAALGTGYDQTVSKANEAVNAIKASYQ
ncbi:MAG: hypothetical protein J7647_22295 [Cyanobacteria bacterium SBLK]|nr:hypothetical protein [Cyanobacteria bacterium SBLK]